MNKSFKNWLLAGMAALPGFGFAGDFNAKEAQPVAQVAASIQTTASKPQKGAAVRFTKSSDNYFAQPFTREALQKAPFVLMGSDEDKAKLWGMCQRIGATETGRKVLQEVGNIYKKTGNRLPIRIGPEQKSIVAVYEGELVGVTVNQKYQDYSDIDVSLAHELTHHIQKNRAVNQTDIEYESLQDAFVAHKMIELETKLQDLAMLDEKGVVFASNFDGLLKYYQSEKKGAEKKYGKNSPAAKRYAKTQTAKVLWEGEEPFFTQAWRVLTRNSANRAYEEADYWNKAYNMQASDQLWFTEHLRFKPNCAEKTTALLQQFADCMGVDLKPDYFRDNLNLAGAMLNVSKNVMRDKASVMRLEKNDKGGYNLVHYVEWRKQKVTVFDKDGQRAFFNDDNVQEDLYQALKITHEKEALKEAPRAVKAQTTPQAEAKGSLKKTLSQNAEKKKANPAINIQSLIKNQGR